MSQIFYIILGFTLIIGINFLVTLATVSFYFYVAKVNENIKYKLKLAGWLTLTNVIIQFLSLLVLSSGGITLYVASTFTMAVVGYLAVLMFGYKYHMLENAILAGTLAIILNPFWLRLFGLNL